MAHPKAVPLVLNEETHHLVYDMNAFCFLLDVGVDAMNLDDERMKDLRVVRKLVWAGLKHETPDLTEHVVGSWIDLSNLAEVATAFTAAFQQSMKRMVDDPQ